MDDKLSTTSSAYEERIVVLDGQRLTLAEAVKKVIALWQANINSIELALIHLCEVNEQTVGDEEGEFKQTVDEYDKIIESINALGYLTADLKKIAIDLVLDCPTSLKQWYKAHKLDIKQKERDQHEEYKRINAELEKVTE